MIAGGGKVEEKEMRGVQLCKQTSLWNLDCISTGFQLNVKQLFCSSSAYHLNKKILKVLGLAGDTTECSQKRKLETVENKCLKK